MEFLKECLEEFPRAVNHAQSQAQEGFSFFNLSYTNRIFMIFFNSGVFYNILEISLIFWQPFKVLPLLNFLEPNQKHITR